MAVAQFNIPGVRIKPLPAWPGYAAGDDGSIWSCHRVGPPYGLCDRWRRMKVRPAKTGHLYVTLRREQGKPLTRGVHRLVLEAFVGPCPAGMEACHGPDQDPANCRLENLRWDTRQSNIDDSVRLGRNARGSRNGQALMTETAVAEIKRRHAAGETQSALAKEFGFTTSGVNQAVNGRTWKHVEGRRPFSRTLTYLKQRPLAKGRLAGKTVRIWSGQWAQWWRPEANGYTPDAAEAGLYTFEDAWERSSHCGVEKKIVYVMV